MRKVNHSNDYSIKEQFPERRLLRGFEGGEVLIDEKDGLYYVIEDEGTMADFLPPGENENLISIYEFDSAAEREQFIRERGWGWIPELNSSNKEKNMNAVEYIISRQIEWANNKGKKLTGSQGERGRKVYTTSIKDNLFQPLNEETRVELGRGDGGELSEEYGTPKIQALHSSSALGINVFDYWRNKADLSIITTSCGLTDAGYEITGEVRFEAKYPIVKSFRKHPNIDVVIEFQKGGRDRVFAIECKFTEAYSTCSHNGFKRKYFEHEDVWQNLSKTRILAEGIECHRKCFEYLDAAQLIKHILGLNRNHVLTHVPYRLLYLWYDAFGEPGQKHRKEIEEFAEVVCSDGVLFHATTYQELIKRLARHREDHPEYVSYLTERYL